jgi:hypothetical protein
MNAMRFEAVFFVMKGSVFVMQGSQICSIPSMRLPVCMSTCTTPALELNRPCALSERHRGAVHLGGLEKPPVVVASSAVRVIVNSAA